MKSQGSHDTMQSPTRRKNKNTTNDHSINIQDLSPMTNQKEYPSFLLPCLLMEFRRPRHQSTRPNGMCKRHPKHQPAPGVCSICLSERLSQLSSRSSTTATVDSSCSSSSLSSLSSSSHYSASASSCSSPVHRHHYRMASDGRGLSSLSLFRSGKNVLTKSRSVAFITRRRDAGEVVAMDHGKKKSSGFWSKLLRPRSKRIDEGLVHSRTMTRVH